ncbi:MAG: winged helix-turn-helix domain-containing protein [Thermosphaera sp.]
MREISLTRIINLVLELRRRINENRERLSRNEMLVRYVLVDPFLRELGWDLENPEQVEPEYSTECGKSDYALKRDKEVVAFIEVKTLNSISDDVIRDKLKYAFDSGVEYTVITDGNTWLVYNAFKKSKLEDRKICEWNIAEEDPGVVAFKALILANTSAFGKLPEIPIAQREVKQLRVDEQEKVVKVKGPLTAKKADYLVLKVLLESGKPMGRKDIVKKIPNLTELTSHDMEKTKSGLKRWETQIRWSVTRLVKKGMLIKIAEKQYIISDEGKQHIKDLEKHVF